MSTLELSFSPLPAHVRTARVVASAAARRAGLADELIDDVKLGVGEACARAVRLHALHGIDSDVLLKVVVAHRSFSVVVNDLAPQQPPAGSDSDDADDESLSLALIRGLSDDGAGDVVQLGDHGGTRITLRWPLHSPTSPEESGSLLAAELASAPDEAPALRLADRD